MDNKNNSTDKGGSYTATDVEFALRTKGLEITADLVSALDNTRQEALANLDNNPIEAMLLRVDASLREVVDAVAKLEGLHLGREDSPGNQPLN